MPDPGLEEAQRLWEQYKLKYGAGTPTGADTAEQGSNALVRAFETIGRPASRVVAALDAPARFVNAVGTNLAGTAPHVDVPSYTLYGIDMETGRRPTSYGEVLAGSMEDSGEITPGGTASKIIRLAGDLVTDPGAAPLLMSGAEAAGALAGRLGPSAARAARPPIRRAPRSRLDPSSREPRAPRRFDPDATQAVPVMEQGPVPALQSEPQSLIPKKPRLRRGPSKPPKLEE